MAVRPTNEVFGAIEVCGFTWLEKKRKKLIIELTVNEFISGGQKRRRVNSGFAFFYYLLYKTFDRIAFRFI